MVITCLSERLVSGKNPSLIVDDQCCLGSLDGIVKVWDISSKQCLTALEFPGKKPVSEVLVVMSQDKEEAPIFKITGLSKFPSKTIKQNGHFLLFNAFLESDEDARKGCLTILSGEVQYQGIAHQFLNPKAPVTVSSKSGVLSDEQQDTKLALDVSKDASIDVNHETKDETTPGSLRTLIQQILQQDRTS